MNITQAEFQNMKEEIIKDLIAFRMEDTGCSMQQAFDALVQQHRSEIMQMRRDRNQAALQEMQDRLIKEAEAEVKKNGGVRMTDEQIAQIAELQKQAEEAIQKKVQEMLKQLNLCI